MKKKITVNEIKEKLIKDYNWEELDWLYPSAYDKLIKDTLTIIKKELTKS